METSETVQLNVLVSRFTTTPILFIGSGFSKRYYALPSWVELLKFFTRLLSHDEFIYESYFNKAKLNLSSTAGNNHILAEVASLVQKDFDNKWFSNSSFRNFDENEINLVHNGVSPFKIAIAKLIKSKDKIIPDKIEEIKIFKTISHKSISGIITTNYDTLLENITDGYKTYVGQEELIFSAIHGYGEIYKIHGSITDPNSILITSEDYNEFNSRSAYLTAKLMTIFMEYSIIFIGYSINDPNIQLILDNLGKCLSNKNLEKLQNRFIYVEYVPGLTNVEISDIKVQLCDNTISMTCVKTDNFNIIYEAIGKKRATFPVKMIRMFKEELYTYTLTNKPTSNLYIAPIDDTRIDDERLVLAIARPADLAIQGLQGITAEQWYRHIILNDLGFSAEEILEYAYPHIIALNNTVPLNKLLFEAKNIDKNKFRNKVKTSFEQTLNSTIIKERDRKREKIEVKSIDWILTT